MTALINYPGSKWGMAKEIVSLMPSHRSYLEPYFGSGAVLFNKPPSAIETINDIDGEVVNFFEILRKLP
ncbi:MAG: DNA adenine methylase, partial [Oscillospiraceae bacterium]|nr:DNA adenine methylase [Oscillospiraceae bacterium]